MYIYQYVLIYFTEDSVTLSVDSSKKQISVKSDLSSALNADLQSLTIGGDQVTVGNQQYNGNNAS